MKVLRFLSAGATGILLVLVSSCSDDEFPTNCRIEEVKQGNVISAKAYYNGDNRLERFTTYDDVTQIIDNDFHIYRGENARIDSVYAYDATNQLIGKYRLIYNVSEKIGRIDLLLDDNDDNIFTLFQHYEMEYDGSQEIQTIKRFNANNVEDAEYAFEWSNGNVVTFYNDGPRLELSFDDKLSLYTGIGKDVLFLNPQLLPLVMSKNNPIEIEQFDQLNELDFTVNFTYQYNEDNLPVQSTAVNNNVTTVTNYTYTCD